MRFMRLGSFFQHARMLALLLAVLFTAVAGCSLLEELDEETGPVGRRAKTGDARCFDTFYKVKKYMHEHGTIKQAGYEWHHIVGQHKANVARFGARNLHCTDNLVYLPLGLHKRISRYYARKHDFTDDKQLYAWLAREDFDEQYRYGREVLERFGWKP